MKTNRKIACFLFILIWMVFIIAIPQVSILIGLCAGYFAKNIVNYLEFWLDVYKR